MDENKLTNEHYLASRSYYHDALTWCVQKQKHIPRWRSIYRTCLDPTVWMVALITLTAAVFTCYYLQQIEDDKWDSIKLTLACLSITIGFAIQYKPKTLPMRIFFMTAILIHIVTTTFIVSFMMKTINDPQLENQVSSIQEIIDEKIPFELVGDGFALEHLRRQKEVDIPNDIPCTENDH